MSAPGAAPAAIPGKIVGTEIGAVSTSLDARWLMAYSAALGLDDPRYYDTANGSGPAAHPLFPVCYEWPAVQALRARTIHETLLKLAVHSTHHVVIHRPPTAHDRLLTRAQVTEVRPTRTGTLYVARFSTVDRNGRPVTTTEYGSVFRGVETDGQTRLVVEPLVRPLPPPSPGTRWSEPVNVASWSAHVYSECARIWNPIHTDLAVAREAGLSAPILHGSATLALAVSQVIRRDLDGDPTRVREVAARLTGMVRMPSTITVRGLTRAGDVIGFDAVDARGEPVLSDGVICA